MTTEILDQPGVIGLFGGASAAIVEMVERLQPSVVQVRNAGRGIGAGVIWQTEGAIITNHHVVAGDRGPVSVLLTDGREFEAKVVGSNPTLDLALLKIEANDLPQAKVADSSGLRIGELVFAIGHPWGRRGVVTVGIISGLGEVGTPWNKRTAQYIRSDVRLAPGNSGGPMLNAEGAVVGINAMIFGGDLSVAIPSHVANQWVASLTNSTGRRVQLGIGVQPIEIRTEKPGERAIKKVSGLLVVSADAKGLGARSGLLVGDILLEVNGTEVYEVDSLLTALAQVEAAQSVKIQLMRAGAIRQLEVKAE